MAHTDVLVGDRCIPRFEQGFIVVFNRTRVQLLTRLLSGTVTSLPTLLKLQTVSLPVGWGPAASIVPVETVSVMNPTAINRDVAFLEA